MIKAVPNIEPDHRLCRAAAITKPGAAPQCSRRPTEMRQHTDGQLYRVCRQHKLARFFLPWSHRMLISGLEASRAYQRVLLELRGQKPQGPKGLT